MKQSFLEANIWWVTKSLCCNLQVPIPQAFFLVEKLAFFTEENKIQSANLKQHLNSVCIAIRIWNAILFLLDSPEGTDDQASIQLQTCNSQFCFINERSLCPLWLHNLRSPFRLTCTVSGRWIPQCLDFPSLADISPLAGKIFCLFLVSQDLLCL